MAIGPRAGESVDRRQILQGVYEDNLRTVLNQPPPPRWKGVVPELRPARPSRLPTVLATVLLVIAGFAYGGLQLSQNGRLAGASPNADPMITRADAATVVDDIPQGRLPSEPVLRTASLYGLRVKTIVIDPGHGGVDPGTMGELGTMEKDITLDVARRLKARLERNYGYHIVLTRTGDEKISLRDRVEFTNAHEADLFVSIHVNWLPKEPLTVLETYYFGPRAEGQALALAQRENEDSEYTVAEFNAMLDSIGHAIKLQESERLATAIQQSLIRNVRQVNADVSNWGVKRAPFVVLLGVDAPGVLAEIGCISNREEENRLNRDDYREKLAIFLEEGILNYLQNDPDQPEPSDRFTHYAAKEEEQLGR